MGKYFTMEHSGDNWVGHQRIGCLGLAGLIKFDLEVQSFFLKDR
jgi:hypothetical protein